MAPTICTADDDKPKPATRAMHKIRRRDKKPKAIRIRVFDTDSERAGAVCDRLAVTPPPPRWLSKDEGGTRVTLKELDPRHLQHLKKWKEFLSVNVNSEKTKTLLEIALRTIELIERNRMLHRQLAQLQLETQHFMASVMANPENKHLLKSPKP